ncbi:GntR family transcriptional regulator [Streptococcus ferus]|uniref:Transcriptional regulator n=1 Tax=Streptococcus ferus TaxID=1345 RepID=A0A2X3W7D1_9STRE|nr:GntR family transcriptional regulator [Streptococcus ferus]SQF40236.1 transcriptional regulator [Streptococcus ferus]
MAWKFDEKSPIYLQLANHIKTQIVSQEIKPGEQLPTVRDFAQQAGVNPNTMQRAFILLEQEGMVFSKRTAGRFVTDNRDLIEKTREELALAEMEQFVYQMMKLGFDQVSLAEILEKHLKGD